MCSVSDTIIFSLVEILFIMLFIRLALGLCQLYASPCFLSIGINYEKLMLFVQLSWCWSVPLSSQMHFRVLDTWWCCRSEMDFMKQGMNNRALRVRKTLEVTLANSLADRWGEAQLCWHVESKTTHLLNGRAGTLILVFSFFPSMFPPCLCWRARTHSLKAKHRTSWWISSETYNLYRGHEGASSGEWWVSHRRRVEDFWGSGVRDT